LLKIIAVIHTALRLTATCGSLVVYGKKVES
jgi:hypothetical protein